VGANFVVCHCGASNPVQRPTCRSCGASLKLSTVSVRQSSIMTSLWTFASARWADRRIRLTTYIVVLALLGVLAVKYAQESYKMSVLQSKLEEAIGKDAGFTETILKVEAESPNITFKEMFDLCDKSIDGRTHLIIELRGLYPGIRSALRDRLIEFLNAENELVRSKRAFYQKRLKMATTLELLQDRLKDQPLSTYGWDYYLSRITSLNSELVKASAEMADTAEEYSRTYGKLVEQESSVARESGAAGIRFQQIFKKYEESNGQLVEDAKRTAEALKKKTI